MYCPMKLQKFPMDEQICEMAFESCKYICLHGIYTSNIYLKQISNSLAKGRVTISQETLEIRLLRVFFNTPLLYPVEH